MELADTVKLMGSTDWKARLKAEYWQVSIRMSSLIRYINNSDLKDDDIDRVMLSVQHDIMLAYKMSIFNRAKLHGFENYLLDTSDMC